MLPDAATRKHAVSMPEAYELNSIRAEGSNNLLDWKLSDIEGKIGRVIKRGEYLTMETSGRNTVYAVIIKSVEKQLKKI
jgi:predicted short-subunit dehydrogenase-like oxidoreductase (DUF2520 family)